MELPKLRPLEALPLERGGRRMVALRDPWGVASEVVLSDEAFFLASMLDGTNTFRDIQVAYMRRFGGILLRERLQELIDDLDRHFLLETPRFEQRLRDLKDEWERSPVREAAFAGQAYPADPAELRRYLEGFLHAAEETAEGVSGIIAPHIDFDRGGPCYGHAYAPLKDAPSPPLVVILGTCHLPLRTPFAVTDKDFRTPLGIVQTDRQAIEDMRERLPYDPMEESFLHRREHTIEFQILMLQMLWGEDIKVLPVLCRSFESYIREGLSPRDDPAFETSIMALRGSLEGRNVLIVASADLAHIGPQFGDPFRVGEGDLLQMGGRDREMLHYVEQGDAEGFFAYVRAEGDRRRICGLPPIYTLLRLLDPAEGKLLDYRQWRHPQGLGAVTFASLVLFAKR